MSKSILQDKKECYITGSTSNLHKHHIFGGRHNRKMSEKYGCWIWLRADWHNMSNYGIHFNKDLDKLMKVEAQTRFENIYGHDKFMEVFRKNYLI